MVNLNSLHRITLFAVLALAGPRILLFADLIPPGNKSVTHRLIFAESEPLLEHRIIAMPVRGFGGFEEVVAGKLIPFSSKYGTRLYAVPADYTPAGRMSPGEQLPFPSCDIPVACITYVPLFSPITTIRSTCEITEVDGDSISIELIKHVEMDSRGRPASLVRSAIPFLVVAATGVVGCVLLWHRRARRRNKTSA